MNKTRGRPRKARESLPCQVCGHSYKGGCSQTYQSWVSMLGRAHWRSCNDRVNARYAHVSVCERWLKFENFLADMGERPGKGFSLDRINNLGNYEPGNARWATITEQSRNKRSNTVLKHDGKSLCVVEWAEALGVSEQAILGRLKLGWTVERTLTEPVKVYNLKSRAKTAEGAAA